MLNLFNKLKSGYIQSLRLFSSWLSIEHKEAIPQEKPHGELPDDIAQRLRNSLQSLPSHLAEIEAVREAVNSALQQWSEQPSVYPNSLVILSSTTEPGADLLRESLATWQEQNQIPVQFLPWEQRPIDPAIIKTKLVTQLGRGALTAELRKPEIVVIPYLSRCFLRCVEGLDGIEYLRDMMLQDPSRFWLVGCGKVSWEYLHHVCKLKAYFSQTLPLPSLNAEQLQEWLSPIVSEFGIDFSQLSSTSESSGEEESTQAKYFARLAAVSDGLSGVAVELFWRSLYYEAPEENDQHRQGTIKVEKPHLPDLPFLTSDDHYLLYSLLVHSQLSLPHLAASLGDEESIVQNLLQVLHQAGIIERQAQLLMVSPVHYPILKAELDGNNFLIVEDE
ncbi:hypothetical protein [Lyngbya aestuarii]|uniref:hypothetical protein n=1 Tax=Lyngbya aestuarii TaxID=118322 RepID=UPI00403DE15A